MNNPAPLVEMIPIDQINVLNPRMPQNKIIFQTIVSNISNLGLKRPITVARRAEANDGKPYDLVCGQGRLEAFIALGQTEIPAIVRDVSKGRLLFDELGRKHCSTPNSAIRIAPRDHQFEDQRI